MGDAEEMNVTYQKELFFTLMPELPDLFMQEYEEMVEDKVFYKLNPAWNKYVELEINHSLHVMAARADGKLIGFFFNFICHHLHYADLRCATVDTFYLLPEFRQGRIGLNLFVENEKMLKELGVQEITVAIPAQEMLDKVMKRLKYQGAGGIFRKRL
jgi:GNAT superfamily N-acetyltransferase